MAAGSVPRWESGPEREASLNSVVVQAIFLEAVPHGTKVDAKQFGRFLFDSLRSIQGFQEQGSFNLFNHLLKVNPIRRNVEIDGTPFNLNLFVQVGTEMLGGQLISVSQGYRAFNDVLELPDIARILVIEQHREGFGRDFRDVLIQFF